MDKNSRLMFADLDNFLFTSARTAPTPDAVPIATKEDGNVCGFLTPTQRAFFEWMRETTRLIPTTARSSRALARVELPFDDYRICSFGGIVLTPSGELDESWHAYMLEQGREHGDALRGFLDLMGLGISELGVDVRSKIIKDFDLELYATASHNAKNEAELARLVEYCRPHIPAGWAVHHNGNNFAILPPHVRKENAVLWFVENHAAPGSLIMGGGDSFTDVQFMGVGHIAMAPAQSQVFNALKEIAE